MEWEDWKQQQLSIVSSQTEGERFFPEQSLKLRGKRSSGHTYFILWCGFLTGVLLGTLLLLREGSQSQAILSRLVGDYLGSWSEEGFIAVSGASFIGATVWMAAVFLCGFCFVAPPLILVLVLFRGLGYGYSLGMIYAQQGVAMGMQTVIWLFVPILLLTVIQLWAARTAMLFSLRLLKGTIGSEPEARKRRMGDYCVKFLLLWVLTLGAAALDGVFSVFYAGL